ncbi:MAG: UDP-glucose dehydrogenase family protein [Candidatus Cyclobacteriaceae bacterium M3_2C_046]
MKISIIGTGYVGLVSGVCLADTGKDVFCIDIDEDKINQIRKGITPIYEPGLAELLQSNKDSITPTTDAREAVLASDVVFIAVGTPFDGSEIDLTYIRNAATEIGGYLKEKPDQEFTTVVVKSTVIPGTTMDVVRPLVLKASGKSEKQVGFCMNPEFLREGNAVEDFQNPDRIVLGVTSEKVEDVMRQVYAGFPHTDIMITNPTTAEMIKYTANAYLALTISYANEIARICETLQQVDSEEVFKGVMLDKRISPIDENNQRIIPKLTTYMRAGCGFGGSCFPKDVKALASFAQSKKVDGHLLNGLLEINRSQISHIFHRGIQHQGNINKVAVLGTAFKPDTDDIRESPGIKIIDMALEKGFEVNVHDYIALENTQSNYQNQINYFDNPIEAVQDADLIYVTTIWPEYLKITDEVWANMLKENALMVDCRSLFKERAEKPWRIRVGLSNDNISNPKVQYEY